MPNSGSDSDTFADDDPIHLDDGVLAILDGATSYASSEASLPIGSSEPDASEDEHKPIISKNKTMKLSSIEAQVDEEGFPLMSLTQEEASVLKAVEEEYQLLQAPKREPPVEDYDLRWLGSQLGGKRERPVVRAQFKEPAPVRGHSGSNIGVPSQQRVKFETRSQVDNDILVISDDKTSKVIFKRPFSPPKVKRERPLVASEPIDIIEILSSDEEDQKRVSLGLNGKMVRSSKIIEPPAKRRKLDPLSMSKLNANGEIKERENPQLRKISLTQPMDRPIQSSMARQSATQATSSARSTFSLSAMVALWKNGDSDELDEEPEEEDTGPSSNVEEDMDEVTKLPPGTSIKTGDPVFPFSATPRIDAFFSQYPEFDYKPDAPAVAEFTRLTQQQGWKNGARHGKQAQQEFKVVMSEQFNDIYGLDPQNIKAWQYMLEVLRVDPIPQSLSLCKKIIRSLHVNLVDLVDCHRSKVPPRIFDTLADLQRYTVGAKVFPLHVAKAGGVLKFLLRKIRGRR